MDDDAIRSLLTRLARSHPSGGTVIERAAVVAAGADSDAVMTWILAHGGKPEAAMETSTRPACTVRVFTPAVGAESVKVVADRVQVSRGWMVPLGALLAAGAVGLLSGFAVPALGTAAAIGLVLYFICAVIAHLRVRDREVGAAVFFLLLAAAALITDVGYHDHW